MALRVLASQPGLVGSKDGVTLSTARRTEGNDTTVVPSAVAVKVSKASGCLCKSYPFATRSLGLPFATQTELEKTRVFRCLFTVLP